MKEVLVLLVMLTLGLAVKLALVEAGMIPVAGWIVVM